MIPLWSEEVRMPLPDDIDSRSDAEIGAALYRVLVRQMAFDPTYAGVAGSLDDLRTTARAAIPDLPVESVEQREEPAVLRALMQDIAARPDVAHLVDGCFDRSRGTILREVTPSLVLAAVALAVWSELDCRYIDRTKRTGLIAAIKSEGDPEQAIQRFLEVVRA